MYKTKQIDILILTLSTSIHQSKNSKERMITEGSRYFSPIKTAVIIAHPQANGDQQSYSCNLG